MASSINLTTCNVPIPADHDWLLYTRGGGNRGARGAMALLKFKASP